MMKKLIDVFFEDDGRDNSGGRSGYFLVLAVWGSILFVKAFLNISLEEY